MAEEKIYTIPLRKAFDKARTKRAPYASRIVRDYLKQHTKKENVKIGRHLNELIWQHGIQKPPRKVRVKAMIDKDIVKAELLGKEFEEFVALKVHKKEKFIDKLKARMTEKQIKDEELEKKVEGKEEKKKEELIEK